MKYIILVLICVGLGIFIGWRVGTKRQLGYDREAIVKDYQNLKSQVGADITNIRTLGANEFGAAGPLHGSSTWIALGALKSLDSSDMADAKSKLASVLANYYQRHQQDGDTNLLSAITALATKDGILSNAIVTSASEAKPSQ